MKDKNEEKKNVDVYEKDEREGQRIRRVIMTLRIELDRIVNRSNEDRGKRKTGVEGKLQIL